MTDANLTVAQAEAEHWMPSPAEAAHTHTPGPWKACKDGDCPCGMVWSVPADFNVATAHIRSPCDEREMWDMEMPVGQRRANARLIAAAPDMLDALEAAVALSDRRLSEWPTGRRTDECQAMYDQCVAVIAIAKGARP